MENYYFIIPFAVFKKSLKEKNYRFLDTHFQSQTQDTKVYGW